MATTGVKTKSGHDANRIRAFLDNPDYGPNPESDKAALRWIASHNGQFNHYIDGKWTPPAEGVYFDTIAPARGTTLARVAQGSTADVRRATKAAQKAFASWSKLSGHKRAKILYAIARAIAKHARLFAVLEALDTGKTIRETREIDIPLVIRHFYYHAGLAQVMDKEFPHHRPGGVVAAVIPWNFPLLMLAWKVASAIAAGNTIVLKPAEFTPLTALLFAEICEEAGLPRGVVNIVTGDGKTGADLVNDPIPWRIAFTGSTEVGRIIRKATAGSGKRLTLELGGKSAFIVFDDTDIDAAVEGVINAIFFNQGQVCCAGSRLLVQEGIYDQFIKALKRKMQTLRAGDSLDKSVDIGAVNSSAQFAKISDYIRIGQEEGATMWQPKNWSCPSVGYFLAPTLFTNVQPSHRIAREEIFGTVLVAMSFRSPEEAVELANNTPFGLAASVWTENVGKAHAVAGKLKAGTVWVNCTNVFDAASGFGGYRESGFGREGGLHGFAEMLIETFETEANPSLAAPKSKKKTKRAAPKNGVVKDAIDRTHRFLIGGLLARPDGAVCFSVTSPTGKTIAIVGDANRKDIRNAVEAARKAANGWGGRTAHNRAQVLYFLAENLATQEARFVNGIIAQTGCTRTEARAEFDCAIERLFHFAAMADKFEGTLPPVPHPMIVTAGKEPIGVVGIRAPEEHPLLGIVNLLAPALAMGDAVVLVSGRSALSAMDFVQVVQNSDVPGGVVNIVTAKDPDAMARVLAEHDDVDAVWSFGTVEAAKEVEAASIGNMKRTWVGNGKPFDWMGPEGLSHQFLDQATQVKSTWVPVGA